MKIHRVKHAEPVEDELEDEMARKELLRQQRYPEAPGAPEEPIAPEGTE